MSTNKNTKYADCEVIRPKKTSSKKNNVETIIGKMGTIFLFSVFIVSFFGTLESATQRQTESLRAEAGINQEAQVEVRAKELSEAEKQLEEAKQKVQSLKVPAPWVDDKTELPPEEPKPEPKVEPVKTVAPAPVKASTTTERSFKLNSGKYVKGSEILSWVKANPNGLKLWQAFNDKYGAEIADKAGISLFYENGTFKPDSIGVCSAKYMIGGDYRNCNYADLNSAGLDVGLKQINTFYQANRITKLGGEACVFGDSRDRNDPCNQKKIAWLLSIDNNIKIALDIYSEQGFSPWYGAKRAGIV
jgi:hypothetical protein